MPKKHMAKTASIVQKSHTVQLSISESTTLNVMFLLAQYSVISCKQPPGSGFFFGLLARDFLTAVLTTAEAVLG